MFRFSVARGSTFTAIIEALELIYHSTVRAVRGSRSNAVVGMVVNVMQVALTLAIFIIIFDLIGLRQAKIRGDFILYVASGVFMFLIHVKTISAVSGADAPSSGVMVHPKMNPVIAVVSAGLGTLYQAIFTQTILLFLYHATYTPIEIYNLKGALGMLLLSWASGFGIGLLFYSFKPWSPDLLTVITMIYTRANMVASGKMMPANMAPANRRAWFEWNPLFHTIDQARGFTFLNYDPRYTYISYPVYCLLACVIIGLMAQFFTNKYASASWEKRR